MQYPQTKTVLNQLVADLSQMAAVIHQTHWYMRGPEFLFLHPLMDEYQDEINDQLDVVAERLIVIDGAPIRRWKNSQNTQAFNRSQALMMPRSMNASLV